MGGIDSTNFNKFEKLKAIISQVKQVAENLDAQDGKKDGTIQHSVWTKYLEENQSGQLPLRNDASRSGISIKDAFIVITQILTGKPLEKPNDKFQGGGPVAKDV